MKPQWQTPEFWATLVAQIVSIVVLTGKLSPESGPVVVTALNGIIGGILSILSLLGYIKSQTARKAIAADLVTASLGQNNGSPQLMARGNKTADQLLKQL